ncbi:MAG: hypothetical protein ACJ8FM_06385, partial [Xanthobacteraceae bacterium]
KWSVPDTWVTVFSRDMGNAFGPKGLARDAPAGLVVEVPKIIVHEADEPDVLALRKGSPQSAKE